MANTESSQDVAERASEFLLGVLERMGVTADIDVTDDNERIVLEIQTKDTELVVGRRGVVVDALQHMVNKVVYRERGGEKGRPLIVDAGGYRAKHVEWLQSLAKRMADKCLDTKAIVELSPMSAYDRRIVHMALADLPGVSTRSEGEGDDRHLCIIPDAAS